MGTQEAAGKLQWSWWVRNKQYVLGYDSSLIGGELLLRILLSHPAAI